MKKHRISCLLLSAGTLLTLLPCALNAKQMEKANAANVNQENIEDFVSNDITYDDAYTDMLSYDGDKGTTSAKNADIEEISKTDYDSLVYQGNTFVRLRDENNNLYGLSESTRHLTWGIFNALSMDVYEYCCVYYHRTYVNYFNDSYCPNYGSEYSYSMGKSNTIATNLSIDAGIGAGFGGFIEAGISFHFETEIGLETTYGATTSYSVKDNFVSSQKYINTGLQEVYMDYFIVKFTHVVIGAGSIFGSGWNFGCPQITLQMCPTIKVCRQLMYAKAFCYDGGRY